MSELTCSRPHWQRGEGMVIFDEEFRHYFPALLATVEDAAIEDGLRRVHGWHQEGTLTNDNLPIYLAYATGVAAYHQTGTRPREGAGANDWLRPEPPETHVNLEKFTRWGLHEGLWETTNTMLYFPLNVIAFAEVQRAELGITRPLATSLLDIAAIMRQPWFQEVCEQASFTGNSIWKSFSNSRLEPYDYDSTHLRELLAFHFTESATDLTFTLERSSIDALKKHLQTQNQEAAQRSEAERAAHVSTNASGGCPGRHLEPVFTSSPVDIAQLDSLATHYETTPDALLEPRPESAIAFGLNHYADLLERAHSIDQRIP